MGALYAAEVTLADRWLGHFMDKLEDLGLMETTAIVLLSDHGHALGDHDIVGKPFWGLWPEVVNIPFFIRHPEGRGAGQENGYLASTHDVAPTVLGLAGIVPPGEMQGEDLSVCCWTVMSRLPDPTRLWPSTTTCGQRTTGMS